MARAEILGYLRSSGGAGRAEVAQALDLQPATVARALSAFHSAGLVIADPPLDQVRQGQRVAYRVNNPAVTELYLQLGQAIGET